MERKYHNGNRRVSESVNNKTFFYLIALLNEINIQNEIVLGNIESFFLSSNFLS